MKLPDHNVRRHPRVPYPGPVRISWEEHGQPMFAACKCVDISESGLSIESLQPIPRGARVQLRAERIPLCCSAVMKHSARHGAKHVLGLELNLTVRADTIAELGKSALTALLIENFNKLDQKL
jgi:hypothetical protein